MDETCGLQKTIHTIARIALWVSHVKDFSDFFTIGLPIMGIASLIFPCFREHPRNVQPAFAKHLSSQPGQVPPHPQASPGKVPNGCAASENCSRSGRAESPLLPLCCEEKPSFSLENFPLLHAWDESVQTMSDHYSAFSHTTFTDVLNQQGLAQPCVCSVPSQPHDFRTSFFWP